MKNVKMKLFVFLSIFLNIFILNAQTIKLKYFPAEIHINDISTTKPLRNYLILEKQIHEIIYPKDPNIKKPFMVDYEINGSVFKKGYKKYKRPTYFKSDLSLPKKLRSYQSNYSKTGYDIGHNDPNSLWNFNKKLQKITFLMSNVAPQTPQLNRILWKKIERFVKIQSIKYKKLNVITGSCGKIGYIKKHVLIPEYFFKIIYYPSLNKTIGFLARNDRRYTKKDEIKKYLVPIQKIEKTCHFNLIIKNQLKGVTNVNK